MSKAVGFLAWRNIQCPKHESRCGFLSLKQYTVSTAWVTLWVS